ncbi:MULTISPECIES: helix-turn-helix domain-containing protein [unclassified Nocardia]|uniref:winged helix-turn-helix transcriptional regulator n=1 Tax=unclassified Nocardia TaxID=2637762 RepID=UPI002101FB8E|nr:MULTISPECIES: helix-turn-helix domain-containing protein [unclassified Nocardia]
MRPRTADAVAHWNPKCAAEIAVVVVGGSWKPTIIQLLATHGILRYGELTRAIKTITPRVLTHQLRELEDDGLVHRRIYQQVPPKVEYSLTDLGGSTSELMDALARWGRHYLAAAHPTTPEEQALPPVPAVQDHQGWSRI